MLTTALEILSVWFLLGLIVGLLAVNIVSVIPGEAPAPAFAPASDGDVQMTALSELEEDERLPLARA